MKVLINNHVHHLSQNKSHEKILLLMVVAIGNVGQQGKVLATHRFNHQDGKTWWQTYNDTFHIQHTSKDSYLMGYQTTKTGYCLATTLPTPP